MTPDPFPSERMPDFPSELVEAVEEACTIIENRCGTVRGIGPAMREALAAVLPLIRSADEGEAVRLLRAFTDCYPSMIPAALNAEADEFLAGRSADEPVPVGTERASFRSADAPQENPYPVSGSPLIATPHDAWEQGKAAGRSAERARLAEIDVMAFGKATCARFTYAEDQPYEAVGDRDSLRLRAFLDAYLRAALSEGTPDKEDTDA